MEDKFKHNLPKGMGKIEDKPTVKPDVTPPAQARTPPAIPQAAKPKAPSTLTAIQFKGPSAKLDTWLAGHQDSANPSYYVEAAPATEAGLVVHTLAGKQTAKPGDWIICQTNGDLTISKTDPNG